MLVSKVLQDPVGKLPSVGKGYVDARFLPRQMGHTSQLLGQPRPFVVRK